MDDPPTSFQSSIRKGFAGAFPIRPPPGAHGTRLGGMSTGMWNEATIPENPSLVVPGVISWEDVRNVDILPDGEYIIKNRLTGNQWTVDDGSQLEWVIAPLLLYAETTSPKNVERRV